ncbi:hypothetical protein O1L68_24580 [Streptomyces lydicus]|nr:hypothetical protein [Streptomyces lydicus]
MTATVDHPACGRDQHAQADDWRPTLASSPTPPTGEPRDLTAHLMEQAMGHFFSAALRTAAHHRIADHLAAGPRTPSSWPPPPAPTPRTCTASCAISPPAASSGRTPRAPTT